MIAAPLITHHQPSLGKLIRPPPAILINAALQAPEKGPKSWAMAVLATANLQSIRVSRGDRLGSIGAAFSSARPIKIVTASDSHWTESAASNASGKYLAMPMSGTADGFVPPLSIRPTTKHTQS
ncbi:MAG TPA: hypothetical protein VM782_09320 [Stellaceae bacterium]|nr:hypothetical protein [Stellaceae bacterium]